MGERLREIPKMLPIRTKFLRASQGGWRIPKAFQITIALFQLTRTGETFHIPERARGEAAFARKPARSIACCRSRHGFQSAESSYSMLDKRGWVADRNRVYLQTQASLLPRKTICIAVRLGQKKKFQENDSLGDNDLYTPSENVESQHLLGICGARGYYLSRGRIDSARLGSVQLGRMKWQV